MTDSDIAQQIARDVGLTAGDIATTTVLHEHVSQVNETHIEFLERRGREVGCVVVVTGSTLHFRPPTPAADAPAPGAYDSADRLQLVPGQEPAAPDRAGHGRAAGLPGGGPRLGHVDQAGARRHHGRRARRPRACGTRPRRSRGCSAARAGSRSTCPLGPAGGVRRRGRRTRRAPGQHQRLRRGGRRRRPAPRRGRRREPRPDGRAVRRQGHAHPRQARLGRPQLPHVLHGERVATTARCWASCAAAGQQRTRRRAAWSSALVTNATDPENRCRVKVTFPWLDEDYETDWVARPAARRGRGPRPAAAARGRRRGARRLRARRHPPPVRARRPLQRRRRPAEGRRRRLGRRGRDAGVAQPQRPRAAHVRQGRRGDARARAPATTRRASSWPPRTAR